MLSLAFHFKNICTTIRTCWFSFALLGLGFVLVLALFYPGSMGHDSWLQFTQAQMGVYYDSHPPIMAWFWHLFLPLKRGPQPMLLFHLTLFWGGLFLIWFQLIQKGYKTYCLIPLLGFLPPLWSLGGNIWKDMGLGYALIFITGLLFSWGRRKNWVLVLIYFVLFYATAVRKNAPAATFPFFILIPFIVFSCESSKKSKHSFKLFALGLAGFVLAILFNIAFEDLYLKAKRERFGQTILLYDLAYISHTEGLDIIPLAFRSLSFSQDSLGRTVSFREHDALIHQNEHPLKVTMDEQALQDLRKVWMKTVIRYPLKYLSWRSEFFKSLLGMGYAPNHYFYSNIPKNVFGLKYGGVDYLDLFRSFYKANVLPFFLIHTPFYYGWFYLVLCVGGMIFVSLKMRERYDWMGLICFSSGILYTASYFPTGVASHFRYLWPLIFLAPLGWICSLGLRD